MDRPLERYCTEETTCEGVPVYSFGNQIYVYGESPTFYSGVTAQADAPPPKKFRLKKSSEIKSNYAGAEHEMTPRTWQTESQPMLPLHLIDGNPGTIWCSWGCYAPDARPEWIRIDLPAESAVTEIVLICNTNYMGQDWNYGRALPKRLTVQTSRDARRWETVYFNGGIDTDLHEIKIPLQKTVRAKQILITGENFEKTVRFAFHVFSICGVKIMSDKNENIALFSRGAAVSVSSVSYGVSGEKIAQDALWGPLQYDLGNKWVRAGGDNGSYLWAYTERERGVLEVDACFDAAVDDCNKNGVAVIMNLDFKGNRLYTDPPRSLGWHEARYLELNDLYNNPVPDVDSSPAMFEAYLNYVRFMARHFKGRIAIYEIGNEWNMNFLLRGVDWCVNTLFKPVYAAIKSVDPGAKIAIGSLAEEYPSYRNINCLSAGAFIESGIFYANGRVLIADKNLCAADMTVSAETDSPAETGVVLRFKNEGCYLAAMYDPAAGEIYFSETTSGHPFHVDDPVRHSKKITGKFGGAVKIEARIIGSEAFMTVSDAGRSETLSHTVTHITEKGSAGVMHNPRRPMTLTHESVFKNFYSVCEGYLRNGFGADSGDWTIVWNYWGDASRVPVAHLSAAIGWHPIARNARCSADGTPMNAEYFSHVKDFISDCILLGFKGEYYANEIYVGSIYPASGPMEGYTEMYMAKYLLRCLVGHSALNTGAGPCHPHFNSFPHPQALCRVPAPVQTVNPCQPTPSYYAWRNAATALDGCSRAFFKIKTSVSNNKTDVISFPLEHSDGSLMVALWLDVPIADETVTEEICLEIEGQASSEAVAYDLMNGTEQRLAYYLKNGTTAIKGLIVKDYPILVCIR
ncbi:MAG: discoidin domain-containing protein [Defluviitaleaceae bacterium]|nr:discoidin domain-containing protein [Defluviitaleaceae bacterium]